MSVENRLTLSTIPTTRKRSVIIMAMNAGGDAKRSGNAKKFD